MDKSKLFGLKLKEQLVIIEDENIIVRELDAGQSNEYEHSLYTMVNGKPVMKTENAEIKLIIMSCYDEDGNKLFDMKELEQIKKMPAWVIDKLYGVAKKINAPSKDEVRKN